MLATFAPISSRVIVYVSCAGGFFFCESPAAVTPLWAPITRASIASPEIRDFVFTCVLLSTTLSATAARNVQHVRRHGFVAHARASLQMASLAEDASPELVATVMSVTSSAATFVIAGVVLSVAGGVSLRPAQRGLQPRRCHWTVTISAPREAPKVVARGDSLDPRGLAPGAPCSPIATGRANRSTICRPHVPWILSPSLYSRKRKRPLRGVCGFGGIYSAQRNTPSVAHRGRAFARGIRATSGKWQSNGNAPLTDVLRSCASHASSTASWLTLVQSALSARSFIATHRPCPPTLVDDYDQTVSRSLVAVGRSCGIASRCRSRRGDRPGLIPPDLY